MNATALEQALARENADRLAFEARTIACRIDGREYTIAALREVFDRVANDADWKAPWQAAVPHQAVALTIAAVEFYHGARPEALGIEPLTGRVILAGNGYAA